MAEYELVREIPNLCRNNQMRDVFFEEVECEDPESYVRNLLKGKTLEISTDRRADGSVTVFAVCDGMTQSLSLHRYKTRTLTRRSHRKSPV